MKGFDDGDQSNFLIHLVGRNDPFITFMNILSTGTLEAKNAFGFQKEIYRKNSVCFSEIPPIHLQKLVLRRYNHGIAFKKDWLLNKGAQRVWYVEKDSRAHSAITSLSKSLDTEVQKQLSHLAPFIDISGEYGRKTYRFEWEREW